MGRGETSWDDLTDRSSLVLFQHKQDDSGSAEYGRTTETYTTCMPKPVAAHGMPEVQ